MKLPKIIIAIIIVCLIPIHLTAFAVESDHAESSSTHYLSEENYDLILEMNATPLEIKDHWSRDLFIWATRNNIMDGYSDGTFQPDRPASEAELLKLLLKSLGQALPGSIGPNWSDGPYLLASYYNLPANGLKNASYKFKPITRQVAAEIITGVVGVNYTGEDAVVYLLGNHMIPSRLAPTIKEFDPKAALTRAEVLEWLRVLSIQGIFSPNTRPAKPSDIGKLPDLPTVPIKDPAYFSFAPITKDDLNAYDEVGKTLLSFGMKKADVDKQYGISKEKDLTNNYVYPGLTVGYDSHGKLDFWKLMYNEKVDEGKSEFHTSKGITIATSTFFDVLDTYGTGGYEKDNSLIYFYEEDANGMLQSITDFRLIRHNSKGYVLSFIVDKETEKVWFISFSTYQKTFFNEPIFRMNQTNIKKWEV